MSVLAIVVASGAKLNVKPSGTEGAPVLALRLYSPTVSRSWPLSLDLLTFHVALALLCQNCEPNGRESSPERLTCATTSDPRPSCRIARPKPAATSAASGGPSHA